MTRSSVELEIKLLARDGISESELTQTLREAGCEVEAPDKRRQTDTYFDTEQFHLARRGIGLRIRETEHGATLGVKTRGRTDQALWRRVEIEHGQAPGSAPPALAAELPEGLRLAIEPFTLSRRLEEKLSLINERTVWAMRSAVTSARAELCVDRVAVRGPDGTRASFDEVEVESRDDDAHFLASLSELLQERAGLEPSLQDKLERSLALLGMSVEPLRSAPGLRADMPLRMAAARVLETHLHALESAEVEARRGENIEGVHRMRVATRRTRAAFRIFAPAFTPRSVKAPLKLIQRTACELGRVRDLDVLRESLPDLAGALPPNLAGRLGPLDELLQRMRDRERARLLAWLSSPKRLRAAERYAELLERCQSAQRLRGDAARPVGEVAPELVRRAWMRALRRGGRIRKHSPAEELHGLRIALKRLRYTAESLDELYQGRFSTLLRRTAELQDVLGAYNDARVGAARLTSWADTSAGRKLPRETLLGVGAMLRVFEERAEEARASFKKAWKTFERGKVRRDLDELLGTQLL